MLATLFRRRRVTALHPGPELLVPFALGADDPATARHVRDCVNCRAEIEALQEASGVLRGPSVLEPRTETANCPDELLISDFVDGLLPARDRAHLVAHLLTCGRCRAVVKAASDLVTSAPSMNPLPRPRWQHWALPAGLAAAAIVVLLLLPHGRDGEPILREPPLTNTIAPVPLQPRAEVVSVQRMVWSSVPGAQWYRARLYDDKGVVVWQTETTDTVAPMPSEVQLSPGSTYFWRVEAETAWQRWASSDLTTFRVARPE